ncbi:hypothetical protein [Mesorhizobium sp. M1348]|uniref:hypothetical protein n=1 Tax=unclassified Mesorhizobium TaxID=325217 RepID=UPI00333DB449
MSGFDSDAVNKPSLSPGSSNRFSSAIFGYGPGKNRFGAREARNFTKHARSSELKSGNAHRLPEIDYGDECRGPPLR